MSIEEQQKVVDDLIKEFGDENIYNTKVPRLNRAFVSVSREKLRDVVKYLKEEHGFEHVTTITAVDLDESYEIVYHLRNYGFSFSVKVPVPKDDPKVPSITDILNGAVLYEREVNDLMGVFPEGHPDPKRLILAYDWPDGVHPLRKEWDLKTLRERVDGKNWGKDVE
ncbi:NADH-quinone oxidoreductase subunit C [Candidatus Bathyarchaeota archaeon]|nr:NADH-quinone oxidoreductase subunit C [Candidatus Bathyarchaeota archaeon]